MDKEENKLGEVIFENIRVLITHMRNSVDDKGLFARELNTALAELLAMYILTEISGDIDLFLKDHCVLVKRLMIQQNKSNAH